MAINNEFLHKSSHKRLLLFLSPDLVTNSFVFLALKSLSNSNYKHICPSLIVYIIYRSNFYLYWLYFFSTVKLQSGCQPMSMCPLCALDSNCHSELISDSSVVIFPLSLKFQFYFITVVVIHFNKYFYLLSDLILPLIFLMEFACGDNWR